MDIRSGTYWTYKQKIIPTDNIGASYFGSDVSLSSNGGTLAIGGTSNNDSGSTWIYT